MTKEVSFGAVVFTRGKNSILYLLLKYGKGYWGFPKGHANEGETERETILREVKEEANLSDLEFIGDSIGKTRYFFRQNDETIHKEVIYYLLESKSTDVKLSFEHKDYRWLVYDDALQKLSYKNTQEILKKANEKLKK